MALGMPGTQGRRELEAFCAGVEMLDLPFAKGMAARMYFVPIAERWIEPRRALTKHALSTAPNCLLYTSPSPRD
eukprot:13421509-Alexandrium_andersonii.AAC.1